MNTARSFVYFVKANTRHKPAYQNGGKGLFVYKIGISNDPISRLADLQNGSPVLLNLIHFFEVFENPRIVEMALHEKFAMNRLHGEWFALQSNSVDWIVDLTTENYRKKLMRQDVQRKRIAKKRIRF